MERHLVAQGVLAAAERERIEAELFDEIDREIHVQEAAAPMALKTLVEDVYADVPRHLRKQYNRFISVAERLGHAQKGDGAFPL
jgi:TPP-dependent pyruvate/acetoin dehydrogenase alpha subunit